MSKVIIDEALMSIKIEVDDEGIHTAKFIVHGGTVNEFTFGTDEDEAKGKVAMLTDGIVQGLEFVQNTVREQYSNAEDEAE